MRVIRSVTNCLALLLAPIWVLPLIIYLAYTHRMDDQDFFMGKRWFWE